MMKLQNENFNVFAEMARPVILRNLDPAILDADEKKYFDLLAEWKLRNDVDEKGPTVFELFWNNFTREVWSDELAQTKLKLVYPESSTLLEASLKDSGFRFFDNVNTSQLETLADDIRSAFKNSAGMYQDRTRGKAGTGKIQGNAGQSLA